VIDPLGGPWTVRRNHKRGKRRVTKNSLFAGLPGYPGRHPGKGNASSGQPRVPDLEMIARADARYGVVGAGVGGVTSMYGAAPWTGGPGGPTSGAPQAGQAHGLLAGIDITARLTGRTRPVSPSGARRPARQRRYSAKVAVPVLVGLLVVAVVLVGVIVKLAGLGFSSAVGAGAGNGPLANPAPAEAGGLPRHYQPETNLTTIALIDEFTRRFTAVSGAYSGHPSALYREPGAIDPATDQPGWVMYLGYNASANLGPAPATVRKLMASLIKTTAPNTSWPANPGRLGGSARCAITSLRGTTVTICAWATERTYGALMSPTSDTRGQELATLMPLMRQDLQG
jgi:hypothetical protein